MKKLLLLLSLALLLCSCHGKTSEFHPESDNSDIGITAESFDENKEYEITFWAKNDTNVTQINIYEKAIADFQELYPNITVKLKPYTDYRRIYNDVITNIATDTSYLISLLHNIHNHVFPLQH